MFFKRPGKIELEEGEDSMQSRLASPTYLAVEAMTQKESKPIYECVCDSSRYHWGNRHRGARVTSPQKDF
jgi:hypothetical protein